MKFKDMYLTESAKELEKLLKNHDWFYMYSDDFSVYSAGQKEMDKIRDLFNSLEPDVVNKLINKYAPKEFKSHMLRKK